MAEMELRERLDYWHKVPGWCAFERSYRQAYDRAQPGARFVEVGSWLGKSACLMAGLISSNPAKPIDFTCIDPWTDGGIDLKETKYYRDLGVEHIHDMFLMNIKPVEQWLKPMRAWSPGAADEFEDNSLDYIMIDGDHTYEGCLADIKHWLPKMKKGSVMAGDDFLWPGVKQAVTQVFGQTFTPHIKHRTNDYKMSVAYWEMRL